MTATLLELTETDTDTGDDEFGHIYCCDPNTALCGADITEDDDARELRDENTCVVCLDLEHSGLVMAWVCPRCGT